MATLGEPGNKPLSPAGVTVVTLPQVWRWDNMRRIAPRSKTPYLTQAEEPFLGDEEAEKRCSVPGASMRIAV